MRPDHELIQYFAFAHLPDILQVISKPFYELAKFVDSRTSDGSQKDVALQKLLESKDAAVRAALEKK